MIIKRRTKPLMLQKLDAIIPRLPSHFPRLNDMKKEAANRYKGYIGEQQVDYHLGHLPPHFIILQDICIHSQGKNFQMDAIVITEYAIYCIEIKNFDGTITFNTALQQFTRNTNGTETGFRHPITQAQNHQHQLIHWLHEHNYPNNPVHFFIAISDPSTIINVIGNQDAIAEVVAHGEHIPRKILMQDETLKKAGKAKLQSRRIGEAILEGSMEQDFDILRKYGITKSDILTGVHCPACKRLGMERGYGKWLCKKCNNSSKYAHKGALLDYLLLVKPRISNKECMRFLNLRSRGVATSILQSSNLNYQRKSKCWTKE